MEITPFSPKIWVFVSILINAKTLCFAIIDDKAVVVRIDGVEHERSNPCDLTYTILLCLVLPRVLVECLDWRTFQFKFFIYVHIVLWFLWPESQLFHLVLEVS